MAWETAPKMETISGKLPSYMYSIHASSSQLIEPYSMSVVILFLDLLLLGVVIPVKYGSFFSKLYHDGNWRTRLHLKKRNSQTPSPRRRMTETRSVSQPSLTKGWRRLKKTTKLKIRTRQTKVLAEELSVYNQVIVCALCL